MVDCILYKEKKRRGTLKCNAYVAEMSSESTLYCISFLTNYLIDIIERKYTGSRNKKNNEVKARY